LAAFQIVNLQFFIFIDPEVNVLHQYVVIFLVVDLDLKHRQYLSQKCLLLLFLLIKQIFEITISKALKHFEFLFLQLFVNEILIFSDPKYCVCLATVHFDLIICETQILDEINQLDSIDRPQRFELFGIIYHYIELRLCFLVVLADLQITVVNKQLLMDTVFFILLQILIILSD